MPIQYLPKESQILLQSGQATVTPEGIVKELLENALDAGSSNVELNIINGGLTNKGSISIKDNGSGISKNDIKLVASRHCTSKISDFSDLSTLECYGFRGEALNSIVSIAETFCISTRCKNEDIGRNYEFDKSGIIKKEGLLAMPIGTIISFTNIFHNMPVRRQQYLKKLTSINRKIKLLIASYSLLYPEIRVQLKITPSKHIDDYFTKPSFNVSDTLKGIYHTFPKLSGLLQYFEVAVPIENQEIDDNENENENGNNNNFNDSLSSKPTNSSILLKIAVPKNGFILPGFEENFFFINYRPVSTRDSIINSALNKIREYFKSNVNNGIDEDIKLCFSFVHAIFPPNQLDVNVEPDKSTVLMRDDDLFLKAIDVAMSHAYPGGIMSAFSSCEKNSNNISISKGSENSNYKKQILPSKEPNELKGISNNIQTQIPFKRIDNDDIDEHITKRLNSGLHRRTKIDTNEDNENVLINSKVDSIKSIGKDINKMLEKSNLQKNKGLNLLSLSNSTSSMLPQSPTNSFSPLDSASNKSNSSLEPQLHSSLSSQPSISTCKSSSKVMLNILPDNISDISLRGGIIKPSEIQKSEKIIKNNPIKSPLTTSPFKRTKSINFSMNLKEEDIFTETSSSYSNSEKNIKYPYAIGILNGTSEYIAVEYICPGIETHEYPGSNMWIFFIPNLISMLKHVGILDEKNIEEIDFSNLSQVNELLKKVWIMISKDRKNPNREMRLSLICARKKRSSSIYSDITNSLEKINSWEEIYNAKDQFILKISCLSIINKSQNSYPAEATLEGKIDPQSEFLSSNKEPTIFSIAIKLT